MNWNPFPITGRTPYKVPGDAVGMGVPPNRNIAPVLTGQGGIPIAGGGYRKPNYFHKHSIYSVPLSQTAYFIDLAQNDTTGVNGQVRLDNAVNMLNGILVTHSYNITIYSDEVATAQLKVTMVSVCFYLSWLTNNRALWGYSALGPSTPQRTMSIEVPVPPLRYDDFFEMDKRTENFQNMAFTASIIITNSDAGSAHLITIDQNWKFHVDQVQ